MVVNEFDIFRTSLSPDEAEPPLRVHPNAVLPVPVVDQTLQPIPGRDPQILDILRRVDQLELPQGCPLDQPINAFDVLLPPDRSVPLLPNDLITSALYNS